MWLLSACQTAPKAKDPGLEGAESGAEDAPAAGRYHEVKPGETVWGIAESYGLTVEELTEVNGLASANEIAAGQLLFIPADAPGLNAPTPPPVESVVVAPPKKAAPAAPITDAAPLMWPIAGGVLLRDFQPTKQRGRLPYEGILLASPAETPVSAAAAGEVVFVGEQSELLGRMVIIKHPHVEDAGEPLLSIYAHLGRVDVKQADRVKRGQVIGTVGETGRAESPRLHFQVRRGRTPENPLSYLPPP